MTFTFYEALFIFLAVFSVLGVIVYLLGMRAVKLSRKEH